MARPTEKKQRMYAHGLLCEDVRDEVSGAASYIGVFGTNLIVDQLPTVFLKLCFVGWASWPIGDPEPTKIASILILPDGIELSSGDQPMPSVGEIDVEDQRRILTSVLRCGMAPLTKEGVIRAYIEIDGRRYRVASLKVKARSQENGACADPVPTSLAN